MDAERRGMRVRRGSLWVATLLALSCNEAEPLPELPPIAAPCEDGATDYCTVLFSDVEYISNCAVGTRTCNGGEWGPCQEDARILTPTGFEDVAARETSAVLATVRVGSNPERDCRAVLETTPDYCSTGQTVCDPCCNPCNPYCVSMPLWPMDRISAEAASGDAGLDVATNATAASALRAVPYDPLEPAVWAIQPDCYSPARDGVLWNLLFFDADTPDDSAVELRLRTGNTPAEFVEADWSGVIRASMRTTPTCLPPSCAVDVYDALGGVPGATTYLLQVEMRLVPSSTGQWPTLNALDVQYSCPYSD